MQLSKIVLPIDFSEHSLGAAHYAKVLACRFHSELILTHTFELNEIFRNIPEGGMPDGWWEERREETRKQLEGFHADEFGALPVRHILLEGDVAKSIVDLAHSQNAALIVMPTHGYGRFRRFILGSVTAKVLHDADCPVLTGAHIEQNSPPEPIFFRNVLCAIDFDAAGEKAFRWAMDFADEFHAKLTAVHALREIHFNETSYYDQKLPRMMHDIAAQKMEELLQRARVGIGTVVETGSVANVVRDAAIAHSADLVVIGRHENPGILGRLRANAYAIVRESPCPRVP